MRAAAFRQISEMWWKMLPSLHNAHWLNLWNVICCAHTYYNRSHGKPHQIESRPPPPHTPSAPCGGIRFVYSL